jgi:hypothetical protein
MWADKSLARPGRKEARKHVRNARDFNNIETRAVINFFSPLHGKAPKEIHAILSETLTFFLPGRANDLSAPLYVLLAGSKVSSEHRISEHFQYSIIKVRGLESRPYKETEKNCGFVHLIFMLLNTKLDLIKKYELMCQFYDVNVSLHVANNYICSLFLHC